MLHDPDFEKIVNEVRPLIKELNVQEAYQKLQAQDNIILIDVREDHEWDNSRIPNSIHIGRGILERDIAKHISDKNTEIILYCGGGFRSVLAAINLQKMGYTNVFSMDGGIRDWQESGYTLEK